MKKRFYLIVLKLLVRILDNIAELRNSVTLECLVAKENDKVISEARDLMYTIENTIDVSEAGVIG
jgi:hypothetical protein